MTENIFNYPLAAPAQSYLLCGNYLYERLHSVGAAANIAKYPLVAFAWHAECDEIASVEEAARWLEDERIGFTGEDEPYCPGREFDWTFTEAMAMRILQELKQATRVAAKSGINEYEARWLAELRDQIATRRQQDELAGDLHRKLLKPYSGAFTISVNDCHGYFPTPVGGELVATLYRWARVAPLWPPAFDATGNDMLFLIPRMLVERRVDDVFDYLTERSDYRAKLVIRELLRIANMPAVVRAISSESRSEVRRAHRVEAALEWLVEPLKRRRDIVVREVDHGQVLELVRLSAPMTQRAIDGDEQ